MLLCSFVLFSVALRPNAGHGPLIFEVSKSHTTTHHSRQDSSGRAISQSQRPLPDNTQHSQQRDIHALGGIRTHDLSRRAVAVLCLRPRGYWDRLESVLELSKHVTGIPKHSRPIGVGRGMYLSRGIIIILLLLVITIPLHSVPRRRMSGSSPIRPLCVFLVYNREL